MLVYDSKERNAMQKTREKMTFDISKEHKAEIKVLAAKRFISLKEWISRAIAKEIVEERKYDLENE